MFLLPTAQQAERRISEIW